MYLFTWRTWTREPLRTRGRDCSGSTHRLCSAQVDRATGVYRGNCDCRVCMRARSASAAVAAAAAAYLDTIAFTRGVSTLRAASDTGGMISVCFLASASFQTASHHQATRRIRLRRRCNVARWERMWSGLRTNLIDGFSNLFLILVTWSVSWMDDIHGERIFKRSLEMFCWKYNEFFQLWKSLFLKFESLFQSTPFNYC